MASDCSFPLPLCTGHICSDQFQIKDSNWLHCLASNSPVPENNGSELAAEMVLGAMMTRVPLMGQSQSCQVQFASIRIWLRLSLLEPRKMSSHILSRELRSRVCNTKNKAYGQKELKMQEGGPVGILDFLQSWVPRGPDSYHPACLLIFGLHNEGPFGSGS